MVKRIKLSNAGSTPKARIVPVFDDGVYTNFMCLYAQKEPTAALEVLRAAAKGRTLTLTALGEFNITVEVDAVMPHSTLLLAAPKEVMGDKFTRIAPQQAELREAYIENHKISLEELPAAIRHMVFSAGRVVFIRAGSTSEEKFSEAISNLLGSMKKNKIVSLESATKKASAGRARSRENRLQEFKEKYAT